MMGVRQRGAPDGRAPLLRRLPIGGRLGLGFGTVVGILAVLLVATKLLGEQHQGALLDGLTHVRKKAELAEAMERAMLQSGIAMRNIGLQSEVEQMQAQEDRAKQQRKQYLDYERQLAALGLSAEEKTLLARVAQLDNSVEKPLLQVLSHALAFAPEDAAAILSSTIDPAVDESAAALRQLVRLQAQAAEALVGQYHRDDRELRLVLMGLASVTLLAAGAVAWTITRSITQPLQAAVALSQAVSTGDLAATVADHGKDEVAQLFQSLNSMTGSLATLVSGVRTGTQLISIEASEIAAGNHELSARTEAQAGSLEQTAAAMEQLTVTVKQNAEHADQAHHLVQEAAGHASRGGAVVEQVITTMAQIKERSARIASISGLIDAIAFQTNLLALNAAVEASRAGASGRGFAVVAAEVRTLAQRSAEAAKEIADLVDASGASVAAGSALVDQAGLAMRDIIGSVREVAQIMASISTASQEQSSGIGEINRAIAHLDEITQQNAAMVEEAAAASQSLEDQSGALVGAVSVFRLAETAAAHSPRKRHAASAPAARLARA